MILFGFQDAEGLAVLTSVTYLNKRLEFRPVAAFLHLDIFWIQEDKHLHYLQHRLHVNGEFYAMNVFKSNKNY